ncbi:RelA/SpoT family protein [Maricaulis salignorans]|uniref:GTP pyrophosphokinase rsh n=1 Tax=Maricaulis salignorans TaxID=144026 RepID=A0A1G9PEW4_9PROT|nr:bifunctional (p)ppGpp synthetase/guanosine-3',5'-bis(diphosphate) 3'-pyrophosphohydrolase [Maricaulis salignorans]SDL97289.1 GTP pyrophosphokinase [Maricaulis salignorans]
MTAGANISDPVSPPPAIPSADELIERIRKYFPTVDADYVRRAYDFAEEAHRPQRRQSGEPYFGHVAAVAVILTELRMDVATVCTGLLHDTVEDTPATLTELEGLFGGEVASLVDGVTKLGQMELRSKRTKQAENLQKLVVAISSDVRVLIVKLCDRLHNMRTLGAIPRPEKRERIARETLEIYAPLARRIGINRVCVELEDLAFKHINPAAHESITRRLQLLRDQHSQEVAVVSGAITDKLGAADIEARVFGRQKRPYSIWRKLERKGLTFDDIADIYAFRVIVDQPDDCYRALGVIHQAWRSVPERFRDFISVPKPNNYRSLHTTVVGPNSVRIELQIRTEAMEAVAESGVAAHWRYKDSTYRYDPDAAQAAGGDPLERLRPFVEILNQGGDPDEFLEHAKLEMFADQVYCFTPGGDLIALPSGATPLDFAYAVHTELGHTTVAARVNGRERPLRTELHNGDVVQIVKGGVRQPPQGWESLAVTGKARAAIRRLIRESEREEFSRIGKIMADHAFRREGRALVEKDLTEAISRLELKDVEGLYEALGRGRITSTGLLNAVFPGRLDDRGDAVERDLIEDKKARLYVRGRGLTPGVTLHFAECCSPLPGDRIVGLLVPERGIEIHTIDCERLAQFEQGEMDQWLDLDWTDEAGAKAVSMARIKAVMHNEPGALAEIAKTVGENRGNIANVKTYKRAADFFEMEFDIEVIDTRHLANVLAAIRMCSSVVSAERMRAEPGEQDE